MNLTEIDLQSLRRSLEILYDHYRDAHYQAGSPGDIQVHYSYRSLQIILKYPKNLPLEIIENSARLSASLDEMFLSYEKNVSNYLNIEVSRNYATIKHLLENPKDTLCAN
jgi:AAA15 family ATPase/GTPase